MPNAENDIERLELGSSVEEGFHNDTLRMELEKEINKPEPEQRFYNMTPFQMIGAAAGIGLLAGLLFVPSKR